MYFTKCLNHKANVLSGTLESSLPGGEENVFCQLVNSLSYSEAGMEKVTWSMGVSTEENPDGADEVFMSEADALDRVNMEGVFLMLNGWTVEWTGKGGFCAEIIKPCSSA